MATETKSIVTKALKKLAEMKDGEGLSMAATPGQIVGQSENESELILLVNYGIKGLKKLRFALDEL